MKIFAKRTKKKVDSTGAPAPRTVNKSDPVVEELLKKDPSEWNAKERRMVKRYQKRKAEEGAATTETAGETEKTVEETIDAPKEDAEQDKKDDGENDDKSGGGDDSDESSSSSDDEDDDDSDSDSDDEKQKGGEDEVESVGDSSSDEEEESNEEKVEQSTIEKPEKTKDKLKTSAEDDGKVPKDHEIWSVLDKLNSKQKRTLSRKLDRLGTAALDEVEEEANKILDQTMPIETPVVTESKRPAESSSEQPTKKKRKKQADWSSLTPEERLRREDQRRKQQEAAERRARGEDIKPGHKRPLNSARRRANRRKPKWERKAPGDRPDIGNYKQEHHSSGFMHRKNQKQHQQEQTSW